MIRQQFPSLTRELNDEPVVYFDGPSGSQVSQMSIDGMVEYMTMGSANLGSSYLTSEESDQVVVDAREAMADFLGCKPSEVAFGQNMTSLSFDLSRALSKKWASGHNIVVTEIDHRANVDPWLIAASEKNVEVRWIKLNPETLSLDYSNLDSLIDENTQVVAITQASNGIGTITDLQPVVTQSRKVGAIVVMDAVHGAPHLLIDRDTLDVDVIICSAYKFFGPHVGIISIRETLFKDLDTYRLTTAPQVHPGKMETGTQNIEGLAGLVGAIDFLALIGEGETRRDQLQSAFSLIHDHEHALASYIRTELSLNEKITLFQSDRNKTPTIAFRHADFSPSKIVKKLGDGGIFLGGGHFYAKTIAEVLNLDEKGGWNRIGMAPYNTMDEAKRFIAAINSLS